MRAATKLQLGEIDIANIRLDPRSDEDIAQPLRAKPADTSCAWINSIFVVMNLQILLRIFFAPCKKGVAAIW